jgi:hypothetical protein
LSQSLGNLVHPSEDEHEVVAAQHEARDRTFSLDIGEKK